MRTKWFLLGVGTSLVVSTYSTLLVLAWVEKQGDGVSNAITNSIYGEPKVGDALRRESRATARKLLRSK